MNRADRQEMTIFGPSSKRACTTVFIERRALLTADGSTRKLSVIPKRWLMSRKDVLKLVFIN